MSGDSAAAAASVSHSLTVKSTRSTGPISAGTSVAVTFGRWRSPNGTLDPEPALAHRSEMRASCNKSNVLTRRGEAGADVSTKAAGAHNRNAHDVVPANSKKTIGRKIAPKPIDAVEVVSSPGSFRAKTTKLRESPIERGANRVANRRTSPKRDVTHANRAAERLVATPLVGNVVDDVAVEGETEFLLTRVVLGGLRRNVGSSSQSWPAPNRKQWLTWSLLLYEHRVQDEPRGP